MRILSLLLLSTFSLVACNLISPGSRHPASDYKVTDEPVAFGQIKLKTIERGLHEVANKSEMIKSIDYFGMDPVTRIINIKMTVNYPLESLFSFSKIPDENKNDNHVFDISVSLPETKSLAYTKYLGLKFHKFKVDGDEYISAFSVVAGAVKTLLVNSSLIDYLYTKTEDQLKNPDSRALLSEILDNNGIFINPASHKILFKVDLSQFASLSPYIEDYENLNLWRFSPTLFQGEEVRFKIIAGEGEPSDKWMNSQKDRIKDDTRTLLQVREDLYSEYSNTANIGVMAKDYLKELLEAESINLKKIDKRFIAEINKLIQSIEIKARDILSRTNKNFIADPEFEYIEYIDYSKNSIRNFISDLDRRITLEQNILRGGNKYSIDGPIVTKLVSQEIMNGSFNFLTDYEYEKVQIIKEAQIWFLPQLPGVELRGRLNLPMEFLLGQMDASLANSNYESKITEIDGGIPFSLKLEKVMKDNGILGLDIKRLTLLEGSRKIELNKNSKNQSFMLDMFKVYVAQVTEALKYEMDETVNEEMQQDQKVKEINQYVSVLKNVSRTNSQENPLLNYFKLDLEYNPFIVSGRDYVEKKKNIIYGDFIRYNEKSNLFEGKIDASIVIDNINNVRTDLQLWDLTPLYSKELDNTFLRLDVGKGKRSQKFIDEMYRLRGQAENSNFSGILYDLGKKRNPVDVLMSLDFEYLESYINIFLKDMVKANDTNIIKQAEDEPGETFYEIEHLSLDITPKKELQLDIKIKSAKKSRSWFSPWKRSLKEDSYSISAKLEISAHESRLNNSSNNLQNLKYFKEAIAINPTMVKIKIGKPSLIDKALTGLVNSTSRLVLNNKSVKKVLLKVVNKFLNKMYKKKNSKMLGHEIEKVARIHTTNKDILIFLNPRLADSSYDLHLTGKGHNIFEAVKLDAKNKKMHVAFTAGVGMAKRDKIELIKIYEGINLLIDPLLQIKDKQSLKKMLSQNKVYDKLIVRSDDKGKALYLRYLEILRKYDHVLQTTDLVGARRELKQRISATGSELMYFASISNAFATKLTKLTALMKKLELTDINSRYKKYIEARNKTENNITKPLIAQYSNRAHQVNKTIIKNKISYWTYLFYADAYFAEVTYKELIK